MFTIDYYNSDVQRYDSCGTAVFRMLTVSKIAECGVYFVAIVCGYEQYIMYFAMLDSFKMYSSGNAEPYAR